MDDERKMRGERKGRDEVNRKTDFLLKGPDLQAPEHRYLLIQKVLYI